MSHWRAATLLALSSLAACVETSSAPRASSPSAADRDAARLIIAVDGPHAMDAALLVKLRSGPTPYFRALARPVAEQICQTHGERMRDMPHVALHGDLHLEQFGVDEAASGLVDFDEATVGPPLIDWLRFATSVSLAVGNDLTRTERGVAAFLDGYRRALEDPAFAGALPEVEVVRRLRAERRAVRRAQWLDEVSSEMTPIQSGAAWLSEAFARYAEDRRADGVAYGPDYFSLKVRGGLRLGIGSAPLPKYLMRVEGPTSAPEDDVMLEVKQLSPNRLASCVDEAPDPDRVIAIEALFQRPGRDLMATIRHGDARFYVQPWRTNYVELRVGDLRDDAELAAVSRKIGADLGRIHGFGLEGAHAEVRAELLSALQSSESILPTAAVALASETTKAYLAFKAATVAP